MAGLARVEGGSMIAWMGTDNMKMVAPVKIGDTITNNVSVIERRETTKPTQGIQTWRYTITNQRNETVMVFDMKFLMFRKGAL
jgi:acyl dehydratase